ncbi:MAG: 50S ribosomal protein L7/L12 [Mycobacteriaceae bacterium]|nr:50S ribosomal protein L7/L12 [Mycobacteriaceae bacterium]
MAKLTTDELLDAFKSMTLLELSEFLKVFEETFGVTASPPVVQAAAPAPQQEQSADEQVDFDVVLESFGDKKIQVIKAVREVISGLGLKEAKDLVERAPTTLLEQVDRTAADSARGKLEAAGARVAVR